MCDYEKYLPEPCVIGRLLPGNSLIIEDKSGSLDHKWKENFLKVEPCSIDLSQLPVIKPAINPEILKENLQDDVLYLI